MKLKSKKLEVILVEYYNLEKVIADFYNLEDVSIVAMEEWRNDSYHKMDVHGKNYDNEHILKWLRGETHWYVLNNIMQELCHKKVIPPGIYLIWVSW